MDRFISYQLLKKIEVMQMLGKLSYFCEMNLNFIFSILKEHFSNQKHKALFHGSILSFTFCFFYFAQLTVAPGHFFPRLKWTCCDMQKITK